MHCDQYKIIFLICLLVYNHPDCSPSTSLQLYLSIDLKFCQWLIVPHEIFLNFWFLFDESSLPIICFSEQYLIPFCLASCNIQGSIICTNAYIKENASLKDCQVGDSHTIPEKGNWVFIFIVGLIFHYCSAFSQTCRNS